MVRSSPADRHRAGGARRRPVKLSDALSISRIVRGRTKSSSVRRQRRFKSLGPGTSPNEPALVLGVLLDHSTRVISGENGVEELGQPFYSIAGQQLRLYRLPADWVSILCVFRDGRAGWARLQHSLTSEMVWDDNRTALTFDGERLANASSPSSSTCGSSSLAPRCASADDSLRKVVSRATSSRSLSA